MSTAISVDLTQVVPKLFSKRVITGTQLHEAQLQSRTEQERANKLVAQVISQVRFFPEKFDLFVNALEESDVSPKVVKDLRKKYESMTPQV